MAQTLHVAQPLYSRRADSGASGHCRFAGCFDSLSAAASGGGHDLDNPICCTRGQVYLATKLGMVELKIDRRRLSPTAPHQLIVTMVFFAGLITTISFLYMRNQLRPITRFV